jgi:hypothetical protein
MPKKPVQQGRSGTPSDSLYLSLRERPRLPLTARIERAHSDRARSASKKGTWPLPAHFFSILENYAFRAANTSVTWPPTLTLRKIAFNLPAWSITNVLRSMPQYFLPYMFFSL